MIYALNKLKSIYIYLETKRNRHLTFERRFIIDECDNMLDQIDMRKQVQDIFKRTPHSKQVMMFSATISNESKLVCRKFTKNAKEIFVDDKQLTLIFRGLELNPEY